MSKQTAVQWLLNNLLINGLLRLTKDEHPLYKELKDHAKAMEKENIIESMGIAFNDALKIQEGKESLYKDWEHYYNKTYGGDK
jgi:hypothetical protein